jgi:hypothetical protein
VEGVCPSEIAKKEKGFRVGQGKKIKVRMLIQAKADPKLLN